MKKFDEINNQIYTWQKEIKKKLEAQMTQLKNRDKGSSSYFITEDSLNGSRDVELAMRGKVDQEDMDKINKGNMKRFES